jgi:ribosomal protein S18 acetylase RimI-like enzyme
LRNEESRTRPYQTEDSGSWLTLLNLARSRSLSLQDFEKRERNWPRSDFRLRLVLDGENGLSAIGQLVFSPYIPSDHVSVLVIVADYSRRRGIGTAMLEKLRHEARVHGFRGLVCDLGEEQSPELGWVRNRGFSDYAMRFESTLDLKRIKSAPHLAEWKRLTCKGINLQSFVEAGKDWSEVLPFFRNRLAETPDFDDLPPWDIERCRAVLQANPNARPDWIMLAHQCDGLVGIAVMHRMGEEAYLFFVGVTPESRGQRIGEALVAMLAQRAQASGYRLLRINNMDRNTSALRINDRLGFIRKPGRLELRALLVSHVE